MRTVQIDLAIIGSGSAAKSVAYPCRSAGWQVAVIDSRPFGGTCALRGCDPKKILVGAADAVDWLRRMQGKGIASPNAHIDWPELTRFKRSLIDPRSKHTEEELARAGITAVHARARFVGAASLQAGEQIYQARHVVIAAGAKPGRLNIPGEEHLISSDQFLELDVLPQRVVFVGGGYVAFEFAHVAARAGSRVTVLHRGARPLERFDPDLVMQLADYSRQIGIDLRLGAEVTKVEKASGRLTVMAGGREYAADLVVHAAGRVPDIDDLDLAAAGIERDKRGVKVNEFLQSVSNPAVYAAGDAAAGGGAPLTPVATQEGGVVARNLLEGNRHKPNYLGLASVVFSVPPLATAGLQEEEARRQSLRFRVNHQNTASWYSSRRVNETCSGFKVLIGEPDRRILGAHLLGHQAEETINLFALAIRHGLRASEIREMLFAYPSHASDLQYMLT